MVFKIILISLAIIIGYLVFMALIGARILRQFLHFPAPSFVGYFLDSNLRRRMQPPELLIQRSGIEKNMTILEIGCGSGSYTTYAARKVGNKGKVYALDIEPKMIKQLENKLSKPENQDIDNIQIFCKSAYELPFESHSIDLVFMVTVLREIPDKRKALQEVQRVLKPKGILAVTEFFPDPDYPLKRTTIQTVTDVGFQVEQVSGTFWNYTVKFKATRLENNTNLLYRTETIETEEK